MNAENVIKSHLDGTFVKFAGTYIDGKWPFRLETVEPDFIPNYCRKSFTELMQDIEKHHRPLRKRNKKSGPLMRVITPEEIKIIRQHDAEGIQQIITRAQLGMGSEVFARARIAAGFTPRKWEGV